MTRSTTPITYAESRRVSAVRFACMVFGTVTVLWGANLIRPKAMEAQAIGTMQVVARVTPAEAAWQGLAAAQEAARELAAAPKLQRPRRTDHSLAHIEVPAPASSATPTVTLQYLRN